MCRKQYFLSVSRYSVTCPFLENRVSINTSNISHYQQYSQNRFLISVPFLAFFFKFHISPTTRKLLVRLSLLSADGTNLSARGPGYRASPNLTACLHGPSTERLTRHSPGRLASLNLTACLQGPFTVCCARLAQTSKFSPRTGSGALAALPHQNRSSKFSPRTWGGIQISSYLISFHFLKNFISHFKTHFHSHLYFLVNRYSLNETSVVTFRVRAHTQIMPMQYSIISFKTHISKLNIFHIKSVRTRIFT